MVLGWGFMSATFFLEGILTVFCIKDHYTKL